MVGEDFESVARERSEWRRRSSQMFVPPPCLFALVTDAAISSDLPDGNSKFSTFEVDTRNHSRPLVRVRVVIDGDEAWSLDVVGRPLTLPPVGNVVGGLGKSLMELLGFKVRPLRSYLSLSLELISGIMGSRIGSGSEGQVEKGRSRAGWCRLIILPCFSPPSLAALTRSSRSCRSRAQYITATTMRVRLVVYSSREKLEKMYDP